MSNKEIAVVIITFNEEGNIERCLLSVKDIADEIVVVDSFSTDKTKAICEQYQVKFIQKKWEGFAKTKNYAHQQTKYEYVLSLDADEALSPELSAAIHKIKTEGLQGAYSFNRLSNYCGKWIYHSGWYPDRKIRLFPKSAAQWQGDFIHETLVISKQSAVTFLQGDMYHYSYYTKEEHLKKAKHYAELGAKKLVLRNTKGILIKAVVNPLFRFLKMFFLQGGFRDGYYGLQICRIASKEVYMKYLFAYRMKKIKK